jgi:Asp-tRNA(Asn)/Glu-tRNA(Gln) amidotransferase A subunit family amidase
VHDRGASERHSIVSGVEQAAYFEPFLTERPDGFSEPFATRLKANMLIPAVSYGQAQRVRRQLRRQMSAVAARFDAFMTPATPSPAPRTLKHTGDAVFQSPWSNLGFPAISIPIGLSKSRMPMGIQLISGPFRDGALLRVAHWCERALAVSLAPPLAYAAA